MSNFTLVGSRYLFCDGAHVCTIIKEEGVYSPILLKKLNGYNSAFQGLAVLDRLIEDAVLSNVLREPNPTDKKVIKSYLSPAVADEKYGKKHMCSKCSQKFYDLRGRVTACPSCKTPIDGDTNGAD